MINYRPHEEKMYVASPTRNRQPQKLSQWKTAILLNSCFSPKQPLLKATSPNFLLFLYNITFLSFVRLAFGFCYSPPIPNCNHLMFLNKAIFFWSNNWLLFLRSTWHTKKKKCQLSENASIHKKLNLLIIEFYQSTRNGIKYWIYLLFSKY